VHSLHFRAVARIFLLFGNEREEAKAGLNVLLCANGPYSRYKQQFRDFENLTDLDAAIWCMFVVFMLLWRQ
jgi:hypothetical protein